MCLHRKELVIG